MIPKEAIKIIKQNFPKCCRMVDGRYQGGFDDTESDFGQALTAAIEVLEEIQQYRELGTVEECREMASIISQSERGTLAKVIDEWTEYVKVGTVEECREAVEKQTKKKVIIKLWNPAICPSCSLELSESLGDGYYKHWKNLRRCPRCGQSIMWEGDKDEK